MSLLKVLGASPSGERLKRIQQSANYKNGAFRNLRPTELTLRNVSMTTMLVEYFNRPGNTAPVTALPSVVTNLNALRADAPVVVWFGHSSYLIRYQGMTIVVDPVMSGHASPFPFFVKSFPGTDRYGAKDIPAIDIMILTHDHYDHLDYKTIRQLAPHTAMFCTSLGVGAHLEYWGVPSSAITELDWWEELQAASNIHITATPARHFSGRTLKRNQTLWSSFVLELDTYRLFIGGDSGYDTHFAEIGERYGEFDMAILEIGQYGKNWPYIHTQPEESVQAAIDLRARVLLPVHWGKFTLALHEWDEPARRVLAAAHQKGLVVTTPKIGEPIVLGEVYPSSQWWQV